MSLARRVGRGVLGAVPAVGFLAVVLLAWEGWVRWRRTADYLLPPPSRVASALADLAGGLGPDVRATATSAVLGLLVATGAGAACAVVIASWSFARRAVYPLLVVSQTVPAFVLAPLVIVWLGFGVLPKVVVVALVGFFPVTVATVDGLLGAERQRVDLVRAMGGTRRQVLRLVRIPEALPAFFAGTKIAATYAVVGAVIAEWMGAREGLGLVMTRAQRAYRTDRVLAVVVVVAALSVLLFLLVSLAARVAMPWRTAGSPPPTPEE